MGKFMTIICSVLCVVALFGLVLGLPLMLLWNCLMPDLFGLQEISFWQAVGLNFLSGILFSDKNISNKNG